MAATSPSSPAVRIAFLGGNGHCAARLAAARSCLPPGLQLVEAAYPGFEGRPRAASLEAFLDAVAADLHEAAPELVYATGIGGLLALCLRAAWVEALRDAVADPGAL